MKYLLIPYPDMPVEYSIPIQTRIFRWSIRPFFRFLFHILCRVRITGWENIPKTGSYLVAINHVSLYEPPLILAFWPRPLEVVGAVEIWSRWGQATLVRMYGGIQVHRGQFDRKLIEQMISAVKRVYPLLIAPEGGRTHSFGMRQGLPGAAYIAEKADLRVLPVGISGTSDDLFPRILASFKGRGPRVDLEMIIGKPLQLPPVAGRGEERRHSLQENVDQIMIHLGLLLPESHHGVYANRIRNLKARYIKSI